MGEEGEGEGGEEEEEDGEELESLHLGCETDMQNFQFNLVGSIG